MPPLGSRLRAIFKNMQKTASRANEKLELLRAGKQCGRNKGDIWSVAPRAPCPAPPAPARGDRAQAAALCSPLPKTPGSDPPGPGQVQLQAPVASAWLEGWATERKGWPSIHPAIRWSATGKWGENVLLDRKKSCCSNKCCVYFPFLLDRRFLILS